MSLVTIIEAAALTGLSTQTLYRHIKSGRLSRESSGKIQTAELIRVYGELRSTEKTQKQSSDNTAPDINNNIVSLLQAQIAKLEKDLQDLKSESLERERQAIKERDRLFALLENLSGAVAPAEKSGGLFGKLFK
jgi:hypothetical protein